VSNIQLNKVQVISETSVQPITWLVHQNQSV